MLYIVIYFMGEYIPALVDNADIVSEAGPVLYLAEHKGPEEAKSIIRCVNISLGAHGSSEICTVEGCEEAEDDSQ
jgi:hypothetical protein